MKVRAIELGLAFSASSARPDELTIRPTPIPTLQPRCLQSPNRRGVDDREGAVADRERHVAGGAVDDCAGGVQTARSASLLSEQNGSDCPLYSAGDGFETAKSSRLRRDSEQTKHAHVLSLFFLACFLEPNAAGHSHVDQEGQALRGKGA